MFMQAYANQTYALFRIVTGLLFVWHGTQKLFMFPMPPPFPPDMPNAMKMMVTYVAGPIELIGGLLVMIGLFTRWSAFVCSGLMAAAYWMAHGTQGLLPIMNHGELAVLYSFAFLLISAQGSGIWSVCQKT